MENGSNISCRYVLYSQTCTIRSWRDHQKNRIIQEFELGKLYNCQGTHNKLRIIHEFELYNFGLDQFDCIYILFNGSERVLRLN